MYDITPPELLQYHHSMLQDKTRTDAFLRAILQTIEPGDTVLDMGCGTGILAYFACLAGAKQVYALEQGPIIEVARRVALQNGLTEKITFINEWSHKIELPEKVDVILTETIGNNGFEEGILGFLGDAKKRFLKENGRILPQQLKMHLVPIEAAQTYAPFEHWSHPQYGFDYVPAHHLAINNLWWINLDERMYLANAQPLNEIDLMQTEHVEYGGSVNFTAWRGGILHGFGGYFTAQLTNDIYLSNVPPNQTPSWAHTFFPLERPLPIEKGDAIKFHLQSSHQGAHWQWHTNVKDYILKQQTSEGLLLPQPKPHSPTFKPRQNETAKLDLFILGLINGSHTVSEIIAAVENAFPTYFPTTFELSTYVHGLIEDYGR